MEPFWHLYAVHKANPEVLLMLEEYRIGNLAAEERDEKAKEEAERNANDPYNSVSVTDGQLETDGWTDTERRLINKAVYGA